MKRLLPHELSGNKNSKTLVVLLHGFPDTMRLWDDVLKRVPEDAQYLTVSYPNFHKAETTYFGQTLDIVADRIKVLVDFVDAGRGQKKLFVAHDFGALLSYLVDQKYPGYIDDLIALDVGAMVDFKNLKFLFQILAYQWVFALCFLLSFLPLIGTRIGTLICRKWMNIMFKHEPPKSYNTTQNYWYLYMWLKTFYGIITRNKDCAVLKEGYEPTTSIVYIYGAKKPYQFHDQRWQIFLTKKKDSEFIASNSGHWVMKDDLDLVITKIKERLQRLQKQLKH